MRLRTPQEEQARSLRRDPYVLAYRYKDLMKNHPMRHRQYVNSYYENLLANQPEPDPDATDEWSRAVRYAQEHFECYNGIRDISRIIGSLDEAENRPIVLEATTLLDRIGSTSQGSDGSSSP
ncbi:hypothetical protein SVAN01_01434 [Stagonosporopsis vannaccii]|nr:hypothetical protein SVAN01_01434 [Stagonosporopsis vannaccii]